MRVIFLEEARQEFDDAVAYQNQERHGLGQELAGELSAALARIVESPHAWQRVSKSARRCRTERFKYGIVYQHREDMILIVAVMHLSRRQGYWKDRLR